MTTQKLSDLIIDSGDEFQVDVMEDYETRILSGEFEGKTDAEIRQIYLDEALATEDAEEMDEHYRTINEQEEAEEDAEDLHIPLDDGDDIEHEDSDDDIEREDDEDE